MSKQYSEVSDDVTKRIERMVEKYHSHLDAVDITALFVFSDEPEQVLKHQGYPAAAVARVIGTRDRAAGLGDAMIVIDRYVWADMTTKQKDALIDHELMHLAPVVDKEGIPKLDTLGRLKLSIRPHDHQLGWFDEVAQRHGENSMEVRQAKDLMEASGQLYFDFAGRKAA